MASYQNTSDLIRSLLHIQCSQKNLTLANGVTIWVQLVGVLAPTIIPEGEGQWVLDGSVERGLDRWEFKYRFRVPRYCVEARTSQYGWTEVAGQRGTDRMKAVEMVAALNGAAPVGDEPFRVGVHEA